MSDEAIDDLTALLPPLLESLDALSFFMRHLEPLQIAEGLAALGAPDQPLRRARVNLRDWPAHLAGLRVRIETASDATISAFDQLAAAAQSDDGLRAVLRAQKHAPRALDALYPLARGLPPVSRFFLDPDARDDPTVAARLEQGGEAGGIVHSDGQPGQRGGCSIYVPEYYTPDRAWPLVMALHGGAGDGFGFLWSWLPAARARGAIVVAPTAIDRTWALMGDDGDTPNLARILSIVRERWNVDPARMLLTGMSDGGTFCYVSGLEPTSPFTHLAPVAASFHPMLAEIADSERLAGLPIRIIHGARDWMFPVMIARQARDALVRGGANMSYREIADLPHSYPREENAGILRWLEEAKR